MQTQTTYILDTREIQEAMADWVRRKSGVPQQGEFTFHLSISSNDIREWRGVVQTTETKYE